MSLSRTRPERDHGHMPRSIDVVSTLILGAVFLLTVFVTVQIFLQNEGKTNSALQTMNERVARLTEILAQEQAEKINVERQLTQLRATAAATEGERDRYRGLSETLSSSLALARETVTKLTDDLDAEKKKALDARERVAQLTDDLSKERAEKSELERLIAQLKAALAAAEAERDRYKDLSDNLDKNSASAQDTVTKLKDELDAERKTSLDARASVAQLTDDLSKERADKSEVERLMAQIKSTIATTEAERDRYKDLLHASEEREKEAQSKIASLETQLSTALANAGKN